jgi:hypothetical protein
MKSIITLAFFGILAFATPVYASGEVEVRADEIVLKINEMNLEVTITRNTDSTVDVKVMRKGVEVKVPKLELAAIREADLESARINIYRPHGGKLPEGFIAKSDFILSFNYGGVSEHGLDKPDMSVGVFSKVRLHFENGNRIARVERAYPQGHFKNKWNFYSKKPGDAEIENGSEESIDCPYD